MFTGLIQDCGVITSIERKTESAIFEVKTPLAAQLSRGDSISVNGVCLTAIDVNESGFRADVMVQTLRLSSLGSLEVGSAVNLELAARADSRLGGHIVQGHVDGIARVKSNEPGEKWNKFVVEVPQLLTKYIVNQGSIALDGVSLTVGEIDDTKSEITVWLIPETLEKTNLSEKSAGDILNIEVDVLAKYVERLVNRTQGGNT